MLELKDLTVEYQSEPLGMDACRPRLSWKLVSESRDTLQESYRIRVFDEERKVWDTGTVKSRQSVCIRYAGDRLASAALYTVEVTVEDNHGNTAKANTCFEMGLTEPEDWKAGWITHGFEDDLEPCAVFIRRFAVTGKVRKSRLYASALGVYEFEVNGIPGSDIHFAPGWTSYQNTVQYQTYDVTKLLAEGDNEICFTVGNGWYKGILGFFNQGNHYGNRTALIAQLAVTYEDGSQEIIVTDESWITTTGNRRYSELYHGEIIDRTIGKQEERAALPYDYPMTVLKAQHNEPVRITERRPGEGLILTPRGEVVIDFGQNLTGVVELHVKRDRGTRIIIRHAEALDENGNFYTANLRTARAEDTFICSGDDDVFRPAFTFHGFRYIAVEGLGEDVRPEDFTACVMHSDLKETGAFSCNNDMVNQLVSNIKWGLDDNFFDIPMDCPQRDERLGYTGDAQIFLPTAACLKNVALFFEKWLNDLKYEQSLGDGVPTTVPNILGPNGGIAIWHDAAVLVPWILYENYGDISFLEDRFDSMVSCVEYYHSMAGDGLICTGQQLGDWVSMDVPRGPWLKRTEEVWNLELIEKMGATDPYFVANVYYANSLHLTAQAAEILGREEEAAKYRALYQQLLKEIRSEYITPNGRILSDTQTACVLALHFRIAEEKDRSRILESLLSNLKQHKNHLTTGFAGTPFLCPVLSENGEHEIAGTVFLKEDCPSWLYHVKLGATTMWELWDGVNPDGSFNKFEMNSLNHYSYGSVGGWVFHNLLGITMIEAGYRKSRIAPRLIRKIPEIRGSIDTVYGKIACAVVCREQRYVIDIEIPANTTAVVSLPGREEEELGSGVYHFEYETEDSFEEERYGMDTVFSELLENPVGRGLLEAYAKELLENDMFMMFAKERPVIEVISMLPSEAGALLNMILDSCNQAEKMGKIEE